MSRFWIFEGTLCVVVLVSFGLLAWQGFAPKARVVVPQDSVKYCRDCRWCLPGRRGLFARRTDYGSARCGHITSASYPEEILVQGTLTENNMNLCRSIRRSPYTIEMPRSLLEMAQAHYTLMLPAADQNRPEICGPEGRYFEQR